MKMLNLGLISLVVMAGLSLELQGKTIVYNNSNYEVKVAVEMVGKPDWTCFPGGSVAKSGGNYSIMNTQNVPGLLPKASASYSKDVSNVKRNWKVWAKIGGDWQEAPVATSGDALTGGIIRPVKAFVTNTVDEDGTPVFALSFKQGW